MIRIVQMHVILLFLSCNAQEKLNDVLLEEETRNYDLQTIISGIEIPWGMTWLPDGALLVTEKSGILYHVSNGVKAKVGGVPKIYNRGQGGLLDIAIHPKYEENKWIYLTYSSDNNETFGGNTKLIRAKLLDNNLTEIDDLYTATPNTTKGVHFGSRIVFDDYGYLYFTIGDRGNHEENPQDLSRDGGKVYRLNADGSIPKDNPFVGHNKVKEAIYSYGHRNQQGLAKNPITGKIWANEHGPQGGDELNIIKKGANYGWPVITYGINYDGTMITNDTYKPGMEQPIYYWSPSIAPSGMTFVTSNFYPEWKGHLLVGSLKFQYLELVKLNGNKVIGRQKIVPNIGRLRNVIQGPDGYIYIAVEGKGVLKIIPKI